MLRVPKKLDNLNGSFKRLVHLNAVLDCLQLE